MAQAQQVPPVARGYAYAVQLDVSSDDEPFPAGASIRGEVRDFAGTNAALAGTLRTSDGSITRVDDHNVTLNLSATITAALGNSSAVIDLVRDDVTPEVWLGIQVTLPVVSAVTAP